MTNGEMLVQDGDGFMGNPVRIEFAGWTFASRGTDCVVPLAFRVQSPPPKPLLVFDGDCQFCRRWIARWKNATAGRWIIFPSRTNPLAGRFPEVPRQDFEEAVHLFLPDGSVCRGAEAVFRALAEGGRHRGFIRFYRKFPSFADLSEMLYEEVALHRSALSKLDRVYAGPGVQPPSYLRVRFVFLRGLALIYLIAFLSFWTQMDGLIGSRGIVPAGELMAVDKAELAQAHAGLERFHLLPTFAWWSASDRALHWQCGLGVACGLALLAGARPGADVVPVVGALSFALHDFQPRSSISNGTPFCWRRAFWPFFSRRCNGGSARRARPRRPPWWSGCCAGCCSG